jgi:uncharacterized membrane protein
MNYLPLKFLHVFVAIVGIGSSAALALVLTFFADDPAHGGFALRVVRRLLHAVVVPGYVLMLASGMWMGHVAALLDARWTEAAMNLWGVGALLLALSSLSLKRQIRLFEAEGPASPACRRAARLGRLAGAGWGAVVVAILYFMVFKPA